MLQSFCFIIVLVWLAHYCRVFCQHCQSSKDSKS